MDLALKLLMGLDFLDVDLNGPDDVTNLFDFSKCWSTPGEPISFDCTNSLETVLHK